MKLIKILIMATLAALPVATRGQRVALKTNLVNDAFLSPNVAVEVGLAPKWTLELGGEVNMWTVNNRKWKHAFIRPELRYWFCQRFAGHFVGVEALGGIYNYGNLDLDMNLLGSNLRNLKDMRYQGWAAGAGIVYGYAWPVNKHWNIEAALGLGWLYTRFDSYPCATCGTKRDDNRPHNYVGPTKAAINIVYLF